jgi:hypothetical protein
VSTIANARHVICLLKLHFCVAKNYLKRLCRGRGLSMATVTALGALRGELF